jgi:hypothetical protein
MPRSAQGTCRGTGSEALAQQGKPKPSPAKPPRRLMLRCHVACCMLYYHISRLGERSRSTMQAAVGCLCTSCAVGVSRGGCVPACARA